MGMVNDAATRHYFEIYPGREPSNIEHYKNVINTKQYTMVELDQLCNITSELRVFGNINTLLDSNTFNERFYIWDGDVSGKSILTLEYLFDVWAVKWSFLCKEAYMKWNIEYKWQAYDDGNHKWIDIGEKQHVQKHLILGMMKADCPVEFVFTNPEPSMNRRYKYWRVLGLSGDGSSEYINLLIMNVL